MSLSGAGVRNPVAANLVMWLIVVTGTYSAFTLVRELFPNSQPEQITITVPYPGATPEEIEEAVTRRVEREIEDVDDIEKISSTVLEAVSITVVTLDEGADRQAVLNEIRSELDKVVPELPEGTEEPLIELVRPYFPVIAVVVGGDVTESRLNDAAREIRDDLLDMSEISRVVVSGLRAREIWVEIQPEHLEEHGLTFDAVGRAVAAGNLDVPGGQLKGRRGNVTVRTLGEKDSALDLEALVVRTGADGTAVRLRDLGSVRETFEDRVESGRFGGHRAAQITIFKTPEQDALQIAESVKGYCAGAAARFGPALELDTITDLSRFIRQRLEPMLRNARMGLILVVVALGLFLDLRVAFWVALGLPISFLGTFLVMQLLGVTINLITLFALIIVLGLLVDDAIIIGENIFTKIRGGLTRREAAIAGAREVAIPVVAAIATTMAAFAPLAFIEGQVGTFLGVLPIVVIAALMMSLFEAFFILPAHLAHESSRPRRVLATLGMLVPPLAVVGRWLAAAGARVAALKYALTERWAQKGLELVLRFALRWRYPVLASALAVCLVGGGLVAGGVVPFVLLSDQEAETVSIDLEMASGTPESETLAVIRRLEDLVNRQPETKKAFSVMGTSFSDRGRVTAADPATVGQLNIELVEAEQREQRGLRTSKQLVADLRQQVRGIPGVSRLKVISRTGGPGGADIEVQLRCEDLATLSRALVWLRGEVGSYAGVEEIEDDLKIGKLEARLELKDTARPLGLATRDLAMQVRNALHGFEVQDLQDETDEVKVRVLLPPAARRSLADLGRLRIATPGGARVPLEEVARISTDRGYASLARVDGKRAVTLRASVDSARANVNEVTTSLQARVADVGERFPGTTLSFEGRKKETRESLGSLAIGFPVALFCIYALVAILFRSYTQPALVMTSIPFALSGAVYGHWIMGSEFTVLSMIGCVALAGIVVNDSLILVDFINRRRREGMRTREAVVQGARDRLRAILLTSITTICGLAPLMLETSFQARFLIPMAISLVFGLASATLVTPLLLPCLYLIYEDAMAALRWVFTGHFDRNVVMWSQD